MGVLRSAAFALFIFAAALGSALVGIAQDVEDTRVRPPEREYWERVVVARIRLGGLGSVPPTCRARCGRCFPCRPIHVAIHPGQIIPFEYYPEAWRCKCRNKLFMP